MIRAFLTSAIVSLAAASSAFAASDTPSIEGELRPGWRLPSGDHVAALHLRLAPGWKTYWRAPGDAGIPPVFNWSGSKNVTGVSVSWPTPKVFDQSGMRSIGYSNGVVLPVRVRAASGGNIEINGEMQLGLCKDICLPHTLKFSGTLDASSSRPDPMIAASLAAMPFTSSEAGVRSVTCSVSPAADGISVSASISMPSAGGREHTVIEAGNPMIWVTEPTVSRQGRTLTTKATLVHIEGKPFAIDRSKLRFTVIGKNHAVDIQGCDQSPG